MGAQFTLGRIAQALGATLEGDPARVIRGVAPLGGAGPEHVSFLVHPRYATAVVAGSARVHPTGFVGACAVIESGLHA